MKNLYDQIEKKRTTGKSSQSSVYSYSGSNSVSTAPRNSSSIKQLGAGNKTKKAKNRAQKGKAKNTNANQATNSTQVVSTTSTNAYPEVVNKPVYNRQDDINRVNSNAVKALNEADALLSVDSPTDTNFYVRQLENLKEKLDGYAQNPCVSSIGIRCCIGAVKQINERIAKTRKSDGYMTSQAEQNMADISEIQNLFGL